MEGSRSPVRVPICVRTGWVRRDVPVRSTSGPGNGGMGPGDGSRSGMPRSHLTHFLCHCFTPLLRGPLARLGVPDTEADIVREPDTPWGFEGRREGRPGHGSGSDRELGFRESRMHQVRNSRGVGVGGGGGCQGSPGGADEVEGVRDRPPAGTRDGFGKRVGLVWVPAGGRRGVVWVGWVSAGEGGPHRPGECYFSASVSWSLPVGLLPGGRSHHPYGGHTVHLGYLGVRRKENRRGERKEVGEEE